MNHFSGYAEPWSAQPKPKQFEPYANNGGSVVAIAGEDFAVIGADSRLIFGTSIFTRGQKRLFKMSETAVLGTSLCWCDTLTLVRLIQARMQMYEQDFNKTMSTPALAQMLSIMLYYKRFFPYFLSNILAGIDKEGKGCVYSYDPIGHMERCNFRAGGSAGIQLQPLLDNQIGLTNMQNATEVPLKMDKALTLLKDVFISAAERDVNTGDNIDIMIITAKGITEEKFDLRKD